MPGFNAYPLQGQAPLTVNFQDTTVGGATGWSWAFGDGGTSTVQNPTHTYSTPGTYSVVLTVSKVFFDVNTGKKTGFCHAKQNGGTDEHHNCNREPRR